KVLCDANRDWNKQPGDKVDISAGQTLSRILSAIFSLRPESSRLPSTPTRIERRLWFLRTISLRHGGMVAQEFPKRRISHPLGTTSLVPGGDNHVELVELPLHALIGLL